MPTLSIKFPIQHSGLMKRLTGMLEEYTSTEIPILKSLHPLLNLINALKGVEESILIPQAPN